jgi:hypothetical protein
VKIPDDAGVPVVAIPVYFVTANIGVMCGFFGYFFGRQRAAWKRLD